MGLKWAELCNDSMYLLISDWLKAELGCQVIMVWSDQVISLEPGEDSFLKQPAFIRV